MSQETRCHLKKSSGETDGLGINAYAPFIDLSQLASHRRVNRGQPLVSEVRLEPTLLGAREELSLRAHRSTRTDLDIGQRYRH